MYLHGLIVNLSWSAILISLLFPFAQGKLFNQTIAMICEAEISANRTHQTSNSIQYLVEYQLNGFYIKLCPMTPLVI